MNEFLLFAVGLILGSGGVWIYKCKCDDDRAGHFKDGSQLHQLRQHFEKGMSIDAKTAKELYGIQNLTAAIHTLRVSGINVKSDDGQYRL